MELATCEDCGKKYNSFQPLTLDGYEYESLFGDKPCRIWEKCNRCIRLEAAIYKIRLGSCPLCERPLAPAFGKPYMFPSTHFKEEKYRFSERFPKTDKVEQFYHLECVAKVYGWGIVWARGHFIERKPIKETFWKKYLHALGKQKLCPRCGEYFSKDDSLTICGRTATWWDPTRFDYCPDCIAIDAEAHVAVYGCCPVCCKPLIPSMLPVQECTKEPNSEVQFPTLDGGPHLYHLQCIKFLNGTYSPKSDLDTTEYVRFDYKD